jgi:hypothetical protein
MPRHFHYYARRPLVAAAISDTPAAAGWLPLLMPRRHAAIR